MGSNCGPDVQSAGLHIHYSRQEIEGTADNYFAPGELMSRRRVTKITKRNVVDH